METNKNRGQDGENTRRESKTVFNSEKKTEEDSKKGMIKIEKDSKNQAKEKMLRGENSEIERRGYYNI